MRGALFLLASASLPQRSAADCSSPLVNTALSLFNISNIDDLPGVLLGNVQNKCANGHCPEVPMPGCGLQSVDDLHCEVTVFSQDVNLGTDAVCNTACNDVACQIQCDGINTAICEGPDLVFCKAGCILPLGRSNCEENCYQAIVQPCRKVLVDKCNADCEAIVDDCRSSCKSVVEMVISGKLERLQHAVSSLNIDEFSVDCTGNGLTKPLIFTANTSMEIEDLSLDLQITTKDVGITSTNVINLDHIKITVGVPASGSVQCGLRKQDITVTIGETSVTHFDIDLDFELQSLNAVANIICGVLPFCRTIIEDAIVGALQNLIYDNVPRVVGALVTPVVQGLANLVKCPGTLENTVV